MVISQGYLYPAVPSRGIMNSFCGAGEAGDSRSTYLGFCVSICACIGSLRFPPSLPRLCRPQVVYAQGETENSFLPRAFALSYSFATCMAIHYLNKLLVHHVSNHLFYLKGP